MFYAVNVKTKEHRIMPAGAVFDPLDHGEFWFLVQADDDGWIRFEGDKCPLPPSSMCEVKRKDNKIAKNIFDNITERPASGWIWRNDGCVLDITYYRPILDEDPSPSSHVSDATSYFQPEWVKPKAFEWNGPEDGLPPIGCEVKVIEHESLVYGSGEKGKVIAHVENTAVVRMSFGLGCFEAKVLIPDTSDEDEAVSEMFRVLPVEELASFEWNAHAERICRAIYKAGLYKE